MVKHGIVRLVRQVAKNWQTDLALPFEKVLPIGVVAVAVALEGLAFRERVFTPVITVWTLLSQVLSEDGTCQEAVSRVIAYFAKCKEEPPSQATGAYCKARGRLPVGLFRCLMRQTGATLDGQATGRDLWHGRNVRAVDGTCLSMPDTRANQSAFPQPSSQAKGCGFPQLRLVVFFSVITGALIDCVLGPLKQSEMRLFLEILGELSRTDVLLGDRYYGNFWVVCLAWEHEVDTVLRLSSSHSIDFRRGRRLGKNDMELSWAKPVRRPTYMTPEEYAALPGTLTVRIIRGMLSSRGFKTRPIVLVTTLLDPKRFRREDILELYGRRWQCELRLRDVKTSLQMDVLRTKTPKMVEKELLAKLLAYNLIRQLMWAAGNRFGNHPMRLSFKGALQHIRIFAPILVGAGKTTREELQALLLKMIAGSILPDRPGRIEPRLVKRRPKPFGRLQKPRAAYRKLIALGRPLK
jgi:hypothetical protein